MGLFWFGWTGYTNSIPWIVPTLSGLCTGFGIFSVFLQLLNYIVDAYLMFAASAIAGNTFLRSLFGCIFPLFATYMFDGMGINWAGTLLGCVAALMVPLPIIFLIYGKRIRAKSKFAPAPDLKLDRKRDLESKGADSSSGPEGSESAGVAGAGAGIREKDVGDGEPVEPVESIEKIETSGTDSGNGMDNVVRSRMVEEKERQSETSEGMVQSEMERREKMA